MNAIRTTLIALSLTGAALVSAPMAHADRYVVNNYYGNVHVQKRHGPHRQARWDHDRRPHYRRHDDFRAPRIRHRHHQPRIRERVVIRHYENAYRPAPVYGQPHVAYRSATPTVVGGIIGGLIGHQMGQGRGKDVATIAGVILGGSIGRDVAHQR
ncbi:MAG TPA: glycine zipper 2TM domain-containing protein [Gammaproteobacteria bacterium]|nr:glycine zipper 2TM domain-containing protein [Gammaproteobacteria bacterium]